MEIQQGGHREIEKHGGGMRKYSKQLGKISILIAFKRW